MIIKETTIFPGNEPDATPLVGLLRKIGEKFDKEISHMGVRDLADYFISGDIPHGFNLPILDTNTRRELIQDEVVNKRDYSFGKYFAECIQAYSKE